MPIIIDNELKQLLKPLELEEYQQLEQSIIAEGCRDALVLWGDILVDGHNRYEICIKHGIKFETSQKNFDSYDDAKIWMIDNQLSRRNLTDGWRLEYAMNKKELLLKIGREKQKEAGKIGRDIQLGDVLINNIPPIEIHSTRDEIASSLNWSTGKVAQAEVVRKEAPEIWEDVKRGELTIGGAYKQTKQGFTTPDVDRIQARGNNDWRTPVEYIDAARIVLGNIDLDPATSENANETIKADTYFTKEDNGLEKEWSGNVWLNPPYGRESSEFVQKLVDSFSNGNVKEAILLINSNTTDTRWFQPLWNHTLCFTNHRINFISPNNMDASGSTHGSLFVYFGDNIELFYNEFSRFGAVVRRINCG